MRADTWWCDGQRLPGVIAEKGWQRGGTMPAAEAGASLSLDFFLHCGMPIGFLHKLFMAFFADAMS
jgi:hypothetical protein